jgi:hypothetical protein
MPTTHHKYSPSKLKNLAICPGYTSSDTTSEAAEEGTMLHECCETGIIPDGLTDEQKHLVKVCRDYVDQLEADSLSHIREQRLVILDSATAGTADGVVCETVERIHIYDYKFGRLSVEEAETNLQGWSYAVGAFDTYPKAQTVTVHFLQPRRDEVSQWTFDRVNDYPRMAEKIMAVLIGAEANAERPETYHPDHSNCLWCGRKAECPAVGKLSAALVRATHNTLELPANLVPSKMDTHELVQALDMGGILKDHITKWVDLAKAEALARTHKGIQIGDYVIERKSGKRSVVDPVAVSAILSTNYGFTREDIIAITSMSITEMEKITSARAGKGKGAKAKEALQNELEAAGLVVSGNGFEYLKKLN